MLGDLDGLISDTPLKVAEGMKAEEVIIFCLLVYCLHFFSSLAKLVEVRLGDDDRK